MVTTIKSTRTEFSKESEVSYIAHLMCNATPQEIHKLRAEAVKICSGQLPEPDSRNSMIIQTAEKMDKLYYEDIKFIRGMVSKLAEKREAARAEVRAAVEKEEQGAE